MQYTLLSARATETTNQSNNKEKKIIKHFSTYFYSKKTIDHVVNKKSIHITGDASQESNLPVTINRRFI